MESNLESRKTTNMKNMTQLLLEACLNKKVENASIQFFKFNPNIQDKSNAKMSYKIWLYSPEVLKDASQALIKGESSPGRCANTFPKILKCSLGHLSLEEVKKANIEYCKDEGREVSDEFKVVLAQFVVNTIQSHMISDDLDLETVDVNSLKLENEKHDVHYLCKQSQSENPQENSKHVFAIKNFKKISYLSMVTFKSNNEAIKCDICNESKDETKYFFCHNDEKYFCKNCDEEYHVKQNYKVFQKHKRTQYTSFSITHQTTCAEHVLKPYEYYCNTCKAVYCIKCLFEGEHKNYKYHEVKFLNDVFNAFELESKSLIERTKQINADISLELDIKEKSAKEVHKLISDLEAKLKESRKNLVEEVEVEASCRAVYLAATQCEISRLLMELDSKISFIKNQYINTDHSTYISMTNVFVEYIKKELLHHIDLITTLDFENFREPIIHNPDIIESADKKKIKVQFA